MFKQVGSFMKNKGQVLISFVLLLPIIIFAFLTLLNIGYYQLQKIKLDNEINQAVSYYFESDGDLEKINQSLKKYNPKIEATDLEIKIEIEYQLESVILFTQKEFEKTYIGYKNQ